MNKIASCPAADLTIDHTPGPWEVEAFRPQYHNTCFEIINACHDLDEPERAAIDARDEANKALIEAAPAMAEELADARYLLHRIKARCEAMLTGDHSGNPWSADYLRDTLREILHELPLLL